MKDKKYTWFECKFISGKIKTCPYSIGELFIMTRSSLFDLFEMVGKFSFKSESLLTSLNRILK